MALHLLLEYEPLQQYEMILCMGPLSATCAWNMKRYMKRSWDCYREREREVNSELGKGWDAPIPHVNVI